MNCNYHKYFVRGLIHDAEREPSVANVVALYQDA